MGRPKVAQDAELWSQEVHIGKAIRLTAESVCGTSLQRLKKVKDEWQEQLRG